MKLFGVKSRRGTSIVEVVLGVFILALLTVSIVGLSTLGTRTVIRSEQRTVAQALVNEEVELIRSIGYDDVGYVSPANCSAADSYCEPEGMLRRDKDVLRDQNQVYKVTKSIALIDDEENGTLGAAQLNESSADYKEVAIEACATGQYSSDCVDVITVVTPGAVIVLASPIPTPSAVPSGTPGASPSPGASPVPYFLDNGLDPKIVWNDRDSEFGIAFVSPKGEDIWLTRVNEAGQILGSIKVATVDASISEVEDDVRIRLLWAGDRYAIVYAADTGVDGKWDVYLSRVEVNGTVETAEVSTLNDGRDAGNPEFVWTGERYGIVYEDNFKGPFNVLPAEIHFAQVDAAGAIVTDRLLTNDLDNWQAHMPRIVWGPAEAGERHDDDDQYGITYVSDMGLLNSPYVRVYFALVARSDGDIIRTTRISEGANSGWWQHYPEHGEGEFVVLYSEGGIIRNSALAKWKHDVMLASVSTGGRVTDRILFDGVGGETGEGLPFGVEYNPWERVYGVAFADERNGWGNNGGLFFAGLDGVGDKIDEVQVRDGDYRLEEEVSMVNTTGGKFALAVGRSRWADPVTTLSIVETKVNQTSFAINRDVQALECIRSSRTCFAEDIAWSGSSYGMVYREMVASTPGAPAKGFIRLYILQ